MNNDWMRLLIGALALFANNTTSVMAAENMSAPSTKVLEVVSWLETEAHRIIRASKREMKDRTAAFPPQVGIGYEAFWLRDIGRTSRANGRRKQIGLPRASERCSGMATPGYSGRQP